MAAKRKVKATKATKASKAKRAAGKAKRPAKRGVAKKKARVAPKRRAETSEAVTAAHRAFDPEATQQLSSQEVLGDIEESMALDTLKEEA